jgi:hypothetical protein
METEHDIEIRKKKIDIKAFLKSEVFALVCVFVLTIPLMVHTANLLLSMSMIKWQPYAYFFAFGIDLAILVHAINGHERSAAGLAFIVILLNIAYYNLETFNRHFDPDWVKFWITTLLAVTSGFLVHSYVTIFSAKQEAEKSEKDIYGKLRELREQVATRDSELDQFKKDREQLLVVQALLTEKEKQLADMEAKANQKESMMAIEAKTDEVPMRVIEQPKKFNCNMCGRRSVDEISFKAQIQYCEKKTKCPHQNQMTELDKTKELSLINQEN